MSHFSIPLKVARLEKVELTHRVAVQEIHFAAKQAQAELAIIITAGGLKDLGTNVEQQKRELTAQLERLETHSPYQTALHNLLLTKHQLALASAELECLRDARRDYENTLKEREIEEN
jgi:hypothetical protein